MDKKIINNTDNIVIVGGGSAGWMTAATLIKFFPNKTITVLESPDIPTIGVGESTLGQIRNWTNALGIDENDFLPYTNGSLKLGIKFKDFYKKGEEPFYYPFGDSFFNDSSPLGYNSWYLHKVLNPEIPVQDFARTYIPAMALIESNRYNDNLNGEFDSFRPEKDVAYHFDAVKFAEWLRERYAVPRGVIHKLGTVQKVNLCEEGISSLTLIDGSIVEADLFVDCTGFRSLLLGDALKEPFNSFEDVLPNNRAWAVQIPYVDKEKELEPYTSCTAIENGWVWNVPLWSRIGTGYVYCDKYVDPETALEEFKRHLVSKNMTIADKNRINDDLNYRDLHFKVGMYERGWVKNVVAIGLSAAFIEPLESNGLFTVHEFLFMLCKTLQRDKITQWDRDVYNSATRGIYENFAEFVALHYALSQRDDTPYWKDISNRSFSKSLTDYIPSHTSTIHSLSQSKMFDQKYYPGTGTPFIATGMNYFPIDKETVNRWELHTGDNFPALNEYFLRTRTPLVEKWKNNAEQSSTLYGYLLNKYYVESYLKEQNE